MPLKLTTAERRRVAMIRQRLAEIEKGGTLARQMLGPLLEREPLKQAIENVEADQNNLRWMLAVLDREDARE